MSQNKTLPRELFDTVAEILQTQSSGIGEFDLIKCLRNEPRTSKQFQRQGSSVEIFRQHFLLMHILYTLRDEFWQAQSAHIEISPLKIRFSDYQAGVSALQTNDALREYYINIENLFNTSAEDVDNLFSNFWKDMERDANRDVDLSTLGLADPVSNQQIRDQYRRLAMEHHPDRGGDHGKLQEINQAMVRLLK